jgi:hypothetical protein
MYSYGNMQATVGVVPQRRTPTALREVQPMAKELVEALRAEFLKLVQDEKFIERLATIEALAARGRELAITLGDVGDLVALNRPGAPGLGASSYIAPNMMEGSMIGTIGPNPTGWMAGPEQFGARAIRELVGLAPEIATRVAKAFQSPTSVVKAIAEAKAQGLEALAAKLEAKLLDACDLDPSPEEPRPEAHAHPEPALSTAEGIS